MVPIGVGCFFFFLSFHYKCVVFCCFRHNVTLFEQNFQKASSTKLCFRLLVVFLIKVGDILNFGHDLHLHVS